MGSIDTTPKSAMNETPEALVCPFCGFKSDSDYRISYHIEDEHPDIGGSPDRSPFASSADDLDSDQTLPELVAGQAELVYVECPIEDCGEAILGDELDNHLDMHGLEAGDIESSTRSPGQPSKRLKLKDGVSEVSKESPPRAHRNGDRGSPSQSKPPSKSSRGKQEAAKAGWRELLRMPIPHRHVPVKSPAKGPRRLGKAELGPYANERQMPTSIRKILEADGETISVTRLDTNGKLKNVNFAPNQAAGVLPVVAQLLQLDSGTKYAYLCHPCVVHVSKLKREGGFCGYRNIQMLTSYIIGTRSQGYPHFDGHIPSIFNIQEFIEKAWDVGINPQGRVETGGVRGTRKYIGTPEAQAMLISLDISCSAQGLKTKDGKRADQLLWEAVEQYYSDGCLDFDDKVRKTNKPPLYFQHPGHSMTIVGIEKRHDDRINLIVFDPMFGETSYIKKMIGQIVKTREPADHLKAYRRDAKYLAKHREFEILRLTPPPQNSEG